jgi:hypothetical protein
MEKKYNIICEEMSQKGWLSHPLAAMKIGVPAPGKHLGPALRSTHTYQAFQSGQSPPRLDQQSATPATLTYMDRNGTFTDRILLDRAGGLAMHIDSQTGHRTISFLEDIDSACIDEVTTSGAPPLPTEPHESSAFSTAPWPPPIPSDIAEPPERMRK